MKDDALIDSYMNCKARKVGPSNTLPPPLLLDRSFSIFEIHGAPLFVALAPAAKSISSSFN